MRVLNGVLLFLLITIGIYSAELRFSFASYVKDDSNTMRIINELVEEIALRTGIKITLVEMPTERSLVAANSGETDGDFGRAEKTLEVAKNLMLVNEYILKRDFFVYGKGKKNIDLTWESIKDYKVIATKGVKVPELMLKGKMRKGTFTQSMGNAEILIKMILADRADFVVGNGTDLVEAIVQVDKENKIYKYPKPLEEFNSYILLNKKRAEFAPILEKALKEMKADGTYEKILLNKKGKSS